MRFYTPKRAIDFKEHRFTNAAARVAMRKGVTAAYDADGNVVLTTLKGERSPAFDNLLSSMDPNEAIIFLAKDVGAPVGAFAERRANRNEW
jgi:hypothetical protein